MKHFILVLSLMITFKPPTKQKIVIHTSAKISQHLPMTDLIHCTIKRGKNKIKKEFQECFFSSRPCTFLIRWTSVLMLYVNFTVADN